MLKNIALLGNTKSPNPGNWALIQGTKNLIEHFYKKSVLYDPISWDDITFSNSLFDNAFFKRVNNSDLLWVTGAVTFNGREDHLRGGSRLNLSPKDLMKIKKPLIIGGVSYRFWGRKYPNLDALKNTMNFLSKSDHCLVGCRNDGTKAWLEDLLGEELSNVLEFPDPGFFSLDIFKSDKNLRAPTGLLISMNNEDSEDRFKTNSIRTGLILAVQQACLRFWDLYDEAVMFAPHSFEDYELILEVLNRLPKRRVHQNVKILPLLIGQEAINFYKYYIGVRAVLASRVHSISPSLGIGNRVVVISSQKRVETYVENIGLNRLSIPLEECSKDVDLLSKAMKEVLEDLNFERDLRRAREIQEEQARLFFKRVERLL